MLELGSGTGLLGCIAASFEPKMMVMSDLAGACSRLERARGDNRIRYVIERVRGGNGVRYLIERAGGDSGIMCVP